MKIELDKAQLDAVSAQAIESLGKQVKALDAKCKRLEAVIVCLRSGMDITKQRRDRVKECAETMLELMEDAGWVEIDRDGG